MQKTRILLLTHRKEDLTDKTKQTLGHEFFIIFNMLSLDISRASLNVFDYVYVCLNIILILLIFKRNTKVSFNFCIFCEVQHFQ